MIKHLTLSILALFLCITHDSIYSASAGPTINISGRSRQEEDLFEKLKSVNCVGDPTVFMSEAQLAAYLVKNANAQRSAAEQTMPLMIRERQMLQAVERASRPSLLIQMQDAAIDATKMAVVNIIGSGIISIFSEAKKRIQNRWGNGQQEEQLKKLQNRMAEIHTVKAEDELLNAALSYYPMFKDDPTMRPMFTELARKRVENISKLMQINPVVHVTARKQEKSEQEQKIATSAKESAIKPNEQLAAPAA